MNILYVHGLGSGKNSSTFENIKKYFVDHNVFAVEINEDPWVSIVKIQKFVNENYIDIAIGCSYGAYCLSQIDNLKYKFLVNPTFCLDRIIKEKIGFGTYKFFCNREDMRQTYKLNEKTITDFCTNKDLYDGKNENSIILFSLNDEFVGDNIQLENVKFAIDNNFKIYLDNSFGHRINSNVLDIINKYIKENNFNN